MTDHVATGYHHSMGSPFVVAYEEHQRRGLVDMLLLGNYGRHEELAYNKEVFFHVESQPVNDESSQRSKRWMKVGYNDGHGAIYFCDQISDYGQDWAWIARNPEPERFPPTIYYDFTVPVVFPSEAVMQLNPLRAVILEWLETGQRPQSVEWIPVNTMAWELAPGGALLVPGAR